MKTKYLAMVLVCALALSTILGSIVSVKAAAGNVGFGSVPSNLPVGSTFTVDLVISGISTSVWQWTVRNIVWNASVLNATACVEGPWLKSDGQPTLFTVYVGIPGKIGEAADTRMVTTGLTGSPTGTLATITFKVVGYGSTQIGIEGPTFVAFPPDGSTQDSLIATNTTYNGLPPPAPTAPTPVITSPVNGVFLLKGTTVTLDGSNSLPGFNGTAVVPVNSWSWQVDLGNDGTTDLTFSGATGNSFADNTVGQTKITLNVSAPTCPAATPVSIIINIYAAAAGPAIDVYTQRGGQGPNVPSDAFGPQEEVVIYANVTYNYVGVVGKMVSFEIKDKSGATIGYRTATTDANGIATTSYRLPWPDTNPENTFGTWNITGTVSISEVTVNDTCTFQFNYIVLITSMNTVSALSGGVPKTTFARDPYPQSVFVNFTLRNIRTISVSGVFTLTIYDEAKVPIAKNTYGFTVSASGTYTGVLELVIPHYAFVGQCKVYGNALTNLPSLGGVPYCPEYTPAPQFTLNRT